MNDTPDHPPESRLTVTLADVIKDLTPEDARHMRPVTGGVCIKLSRVLRTSHSVRRP